MSIVFSINMTWTENSRPSCWVRVAEGNTEKKEKRKSTSWPVSCRFSWIWFRLIPDPPVEPLYLRATQRSWEAKIELRPLGNTAKLRRREGECKSTSWPVSCRLCRDLRRKRPRFCDIDQHNKSLVLDIKHWEYLVGIRKRENKEGLENVPDHVTSTSTLHRHFNMKIQFSKGHSSPFLMLK